MGIYSRLPKQKEIASVYAVIVLMIYGWTIFKFNYNLPGWLYYLNLGEIASVLAYSLVTNLLESLMVVFGMVVVAVVLPKKWFLDAFVARGTVVSILILALLMYVASQFKTLDYYPSEIVRWSPVLLVLIAVIAYLLGRVSFTRRMLELFADRALIFLYITIPLSVVSLVVVLFRLIL
ncbi:MAG: hypothetical protein AB1649_01115 [Chloroflexota bacterium]